jgi:hypothetical protein
MWPEKNLTVIQIGTEIIGKMFIEEPKSQDSKFHNKFNYIGRKKLGFFYSLTKKTSIQIY